MELNEAKSILKENGYIADKQFTLNLNETELKLLKSVISDYINMEDLNQMELTKEEIACYEGIEKKVFALLREVDQ